MSSDAPLDQLTPRRPWVQKPAPTPVSPMRARAQESATRHEELHAQLKGIERYQQVRLPGFREILQEWDNYRRDRQLSWRDMWMFKADISSPTGRPSPRCGAPS